MSHRPTHERLAVIERKLADHDAQLEEVEDYLGFGDVESEETIDEGVVEHEAVYVREDISVADRFEDVSSWVPDDEDGVTPREDYTRVTTVGHIELYHDEHGDFLITTEGIRRNNEDGIHVEKGDLITLAEIIGFENEVRFE